MTQWRVPLSRPDIDDSDRRAVAEVLERDVLSLGPEATAFEEEFSTFLDGRVSAACVSNGTAGLYLALQALGVDHGEVLTPSYGFVGTAHAIRMAGATPRFVDVDPNTLVVSLESLRAAWTPRVTALIPVHIFGTPPPIPAICAWAEELGVPVIEDACEAIGGRNDGLPCGSIGDAGVFAFYPNKQMTTGEGGMVVARSTAVTERIRSLRNQGRGSGEFEFVAEGFNFRLSELQCALGRSQLRRLPGFLAARERVATTYISGLASIAGLSPLGPVRSGDSRSWFVFPVLVDEAAWRQPVRDLLSANGIQTAPYFRAVHEMAPYRAAEFRGELPITEDVAQRSFAIPFHNRLTPDECQFVLDSLRSAMAQIQAAIPAQTSP